MDKPINLIMEEAKKDYVNAINDVTKKHKINMYLAEIIIRGIYEEVVNMRNQELEQAKQEYAENTKEKKDTKKRVL